MTREKVDYLSIDVRRAETDVVGPGKWLKYYSTLCCSLQQNMIHLLYICIPQFSHISFTLPNLTFIIDVETFVYLKRNPKLSKKGGTEYEI